MMFQKILEPWAEPVDGSAVPGLKDHKSIAWVKFPNDFRLEGAAEKSCAITRDSAAPSGQGAID